MDTANGRVTSECTKRAAHAVSSPPPCGEGLGVGVVRLGSSFARTPDPLPSPPPQGGRSRLSVLPVKTDSREFLVGCQCGAQGRASSPGTPNTCRAANLHANPLSSNGGQRSRTAQLDRGLGCPPAAFGRWCSRGASLVERKDSLRGCVRYLTLPGSSNGPETRHSSDPAIGAPAR